MCSRKCVDEFRLSKSSQTFSLLVIIFLLLGIDLKIVKTTYSYVYRVKFKREDK